MNTTNKNIQVTTSSKPARHHQPKVEALHQTMVQLNGGSDISLVAGINDYTMLGIYGEVGSDMSRFPTKKHFVSWLGLSPKNKQSGKTPVLNEEKYLKASQNFFKQCRTHFSSSCSKPVY
jgi:transposase